MDMREFYQKIKEVEAAISTPEVIVVSNVTPDGGVAGVKTAVKKSLAARMIAEGKARLATDKEAKSYRQENSEAYQASLDAINASRVQVTVLSEQEMKAIKSALKGK